MDVHVALPNGHRGVTLAQLTEITEAAEELGFTGVWPLDHVLVGPDLSRRRANDSRSSSAVDLTPPSNARRLLAMSGSRPDCSRTNSPSRRRRCEPSRRAGESNWVHAPHLSATRIACWRRSRPSKR